MIFDLVAAGFGSGVAANIINILATGASIASVLALFSGVASGSAGLFAAVKAALVGGAKKKAIAL